MSNPFEHLQFVRGFNRSGDLVGRFSLFSSDERSSSYVVGQTGQEVQHSTQMLFLSGLEVEPLECRHARKMATGSGCFISFDDAADLAFPGRYLLAEEPDLKLLTRQRVRVHWLLEGLIETPCFYASFLESEISNVVNDWGFPIGRRSEALKVSAGLMPMEWDVFGVMTEDFAIGGALEIVGATGENFYEANLIAVHQVRRDLTKGEPLLARFQATIGGTAIVAQRILATVQDAGVAGLPPIRPVGD